MSKFEVYERNGVTNISMVSSLLFLTTKGFISPINAIVTSSLLQALMASATKDERKLISKRSPENWKTFNFSFADPTNDEREMISTSSSVMMTLTTPSCSAESKETRSIAFKIRQN